MHKIFIDICEIFMWTNHVYQAVNCMCCKQDGAKILHEWGPVYQPNCFHEKQIKIMIILCTSTYYTVVKHNFDTHDPQLTQLSTQ
jgi:hypothetical protein